MILTITYNVNFAFALFLIVLYSFAWLPLAFVAFAIVRRRFTLRQLMIFVLIEAIALSGALLLVKYVDMD